MTEEPPRKIESIQYIRALGALIVVVWHTGWSRSFLGQSGVDLFFVVSGFVMMLVSGRENSPARFMLARLLRVVPLYWAVTLGVAAILRPSAAELVQSLLFLPVGAFPVVIQGWSLNLEMSYYALFALSLLAPPRWRLAALAVAIGAMCGVLPLVAAPGGMVAAWANPMAVEFLAGAGLFALWQRGLVPAGVSAWAVGVVGAAVLLGTHALGGGLLGWPRVALWGLPAVAIVAAGLGIERAGQLPRLTLVGALGEASYAIYLTHLAVLWVIGPVLVSLWAPVAVAIAVVVTCVVGWAVHRAFERPMHRWTSAWVRRRWPARQTRPA